MGGAMKSPRQRAFMARGGGTEWGSRQVSFFEMLKVTDPWEEDSIGVGVFQGIRPPKKWHKVPPMTSATHDTAWPSSPSSRSRVGAKSLRRLREEHRTDMVNLEERFGSLYRNLTCVEVGQDAEEEDEGEVEHGAVALNAKDFVNPLSRAVPLATELSPDPYDSIMQSRSRLSNAPRGGRLRGKPGSVGGSVSGLWLGALMSLKKGKGRGRGPATGKMSDAGVGQTRKPDGRRPRRKSSSESPPPGYGLKPDGTGEVGLPIVTKDLKEIKFPTMFLRKSHARYKLARVGASDVDVDGMEERKKSSQSKSTLLPFLDGVQGNWRALSVLTTAMRLKQTLSLMSAPAAAAAVTSCNSKRSKSAQGSVDEKDKENKDANSSCFNPGDNVVWEWHQGFAKARNVKRKELDHVLHCREDLRRRACSSTPLSAGAVRMLMDELPNTMEAPTLRKGSIWERAEAEEKRRTEEALVRAQVERRRRDSQTASDGGGGEGSPLLTPGGTAMRRAFTINVRRWQPEEGIEGLLARLSMFLERLGTRDPLDTFIFHELERLVDAGGQTPSDLIIGLLQRLATLKRVASLSTHPHLVPILRFLQQYSDLPRDAFLNLQRKQHMWPLDNWWPDNTPLNNNNNNSPPKRSPTFKSSKSIARRHRPSILTFDN